MDQTPIHKYKQVILLRTDLKMGKGKVAVQAAHASVVALRETQEKRPEWCDAWFKENQCKVCLKVGSEEELLSYKQKVESQNIPFALIRDRGLTQIPPGTITCLGIGPCPSNLIDPITGGLPLF